jgi:hypothetical protein
MTDWPIQFDEDAPEYEKALVAALDAREDIDEQKLKLYNFLQGRTNAIAVEDLPAYSDFLDAVEAGLVPRRYRGEEGYEFKAGTIDDLINDFWLDRKYFPLDVIIGIWAGTHCPLDCHEYNPKQVEVLDAN